MAAWCYSLVVGCWLFVAPGRRAYLVYHQHEQRTPERQRTTNNGEAVTELNQQPTTNNGEAVTELNQQPTTNNQQLPPRSHGRPASRAATKDAVQRVLSAELRAGATQLGHAVGCCGPGAGT